MTAPFMATPQQARSKESLERVLAAGLEILKEGGYERLSIADVCARAEVSVGSIYARFRSKAALFAALQVRGLELIDGELDALFLGLPGAGDPDVLIVTALVERVARHVRKHEALLRVMILRGAVDAETRRRGSASSSLLAQRFECHLLQNLRSPVRADAGLAVDVAFRILYATLTRRVASGPAFESPRGLEWDGLVTELGQALAAYLLCSPSG